MNSDSSSFSGENENKFSNKIIININDSYGAITTKKFEENITNITIEEAMKSHLDKIGCENYEEMIFQLF